ncbi:MAG TPA: hypothetical protein VKG82_08640 [Solirubrobacteraceae bacterium]|nr:hypothetical protein [Solirubrobacteraceae bacterium]
MDPRARAAVIAAELAQGRALAHKPPGTRLSELNNVLGSYS